MFFLLFVAAAAGFRSTFLSWSHQASWGKKCGHQVATLESVGTIDVPCPLAIDDMVHALPRNLSAKLLAGMEYSKYHPEDYVEGSLGYKLRWSGKKLLTYEEPCRADEKCSFHVDFSESQGWSTKFHVSLVLGERPKEESKWKPSTSSSHSVSFLGPTIAAVYANQIMYEVTWRSKPPANTLCFFCRGDLKKALLPISYDNSPVGILFLHQRTLSSRK
ncbi:hypothetical protein DSO57_1003833 [Entomophthora muscae]|uniref:Uncharacterized protein n=1 Tax=Entomophthora muscae TaxID=34485 RepID=A0ACC2UU80_9FUNG|nr:hypothetical protein DSO57_1003833 [Entomophthora muscae]